MGASLLLCLELVLELGAGVGQAFTSTDDRDSHQFATKKLHITLVLSGCCSEVPNT